MRISWQFVAVANLAFLFSGATARAQFGSTLPQNSTQQPSRTTTTTTPGSTPGSGAAGGASGPTLNTEAGTTGVDRNFGSGFVGGSDNSGRFVGSQFAGQQRTSGTSRPGSNSFGRNNRGRGSTRGRGQTTRRTTGRNSGRTQVRPRQRIAFSFAPRTTVSIQTSLTKRFTDIVKRRAELKAVSILVGKKGELTLKGEVPTEAARRIASNLVRMEPGVKKITNELTVVAAATPTG